MSFRIGQKVRIVKAHEGAAHRIGLVATVTDGPLPASWVWPLKRTMAEHGFPDGTPVFALNLEPIMGAATACYPPAWLEPIDDGRDALAWTAELRNLCGVKRTERA